MNSKEDATKRLRVAERHLREADEASKRDDYPEVVGHSQLSVENSAKTVIACFRIPSWTHDPSGELVTVLSEMKIEKSLADGLQSLGEYAHKLAPEHATADYGTVSKLPEEIYGEDDARDALQMAREGVEIAGQFLQYYFGTG